MAFFSPSTGRGCLISKINTGTATGVTLSTHLKKEVWLEIKPL